MPQKPLPLIISLKRWREQNGFSQSDAVRVLTNTGIPVTLDSLQNWESGRRSPRAELALALADADTILCPIRVNILFASSGEKTFSPSSTKAVSPSSFS
jgi:transcriptional regulator with XRE-family HTH domain